MTDGVKHSEDDAALEVIDVAAAEVIPPNAEQAPDVRKRDRLAEHGQRLIAQGVLLRRGLELSMFWGKASSQYKAVFLVESDVSEELVSWCGDKGVLVVGTKFEAAKANLPVVALYEESSCLESDEWEAALIVRTEDDARQTLGLLLQLVEKRLSSHPRKSNASEAATLQQTPELEGGAAGSESAHDSDGEPMNGFKAKFSRVAGMVVKKAKGETTNDKEG